MKLACIVSGMSIVLLAACGGGDDGDSGPSQSSLQSAGLALVESTVKDDKGQPVDGARVSLPVKSGEYATTTDSQGKYSMTVKASDFTGVSPVAMTISKTGYRPQTVYYQSLSAGNRYSVNFSEPGFQVKALAEGEFVPEFASSLIHLGNDSYSGSANSQLQVSTRGKSVILTVGKVTEEMLSKYKQVNVSFVARGVQTNSGSNGPYPNKVGLTSNTYLAHQAPGDSASNGSFTAYNHTFSTTGLQANQDFYVFFESGLGRGGDYDDFEFTQVLVKFIP